MTTDRPQPPAHSRSLGPAFEVSLRRPTRDDVPTIFEMVSDPQGNLMARTKPRPRDVFMARWEVVLVDPAINSQVIEIVTPGPGGGTGGLATREFVGTISVFQSPGETRNEMGYWIARPHWGKGIASRALELFLLQELRRPLHATASMTNLASHRVMLKNGFRLVRRYKSEESDRLMARETAEFLLE